MDHLYSTTTGHRRGTASYIVYRILIGQFSRKTSLISEKDKNSEIRHQLLHFVFPGSVALNLKILLSQKYAFNNIRFNHMNSIGFDFINNTDFNSIVVL